MLVTRRRKGLDGITLALYRTVNPNPTALYRTVNPNPRRCRVAAWGLQALKEAPGDGQDLLPAPQCLLVHRAPGGGGEATGRRRGRRQHQSLS